MSDILPVTVVVAYLSCGCITWIPVGIDLPGYCEKHDDENVDTQYTETRTVQKP